MSSRKFEMPSTVRTCRCITLHTYPAFVTAEAWHVAIHICHCGREHVEEAIPVIPAPPTATRRRVQKKKVQLKRKRPARS